MPDRTLNWGDSEADARYRTQDSDPTGGDFVVVEDLSGDGQLLLWDYTAGEFVYGGPVNLGSNGLTTTGTVTAGALEADDQITTNQTWFGDVSTNPDDADVVAFNDKGSGTSSVVRPFIGIAAVGGTINSDNTAQNLINSSQEDLKLENGEITICYRKQGSTTARTDKLRVAQASGLETDTAATNGLPAASSYSFSSGNYQVALDGDGTDYNYVLMAQMGALSP